MLYFIIQGSVAWIVVARLCKQAIYWRAEEECCENLDLVACESERNDCCAVRFEEAEKKKKHGLDITDFVCC